MGTHYPTDVEIAIIGGAAILTAYCIWRARFQICDWSPSAPFHWERKRAAMAALTANDVMVITDFDATITTGDSEQCHDDVCVPPSLAVPLPVRLLASTSPK